MLVKYLSNQVPDYASQLLVRFFILLIGFDFGEIRTLHTKKRLNFFFKQLNILILLIVTELTNNVFVQKRVKLIVVLPFKECKGGYGKIIHDPPPTTVDHKPPQIDGKLNIGLELYLLNERFSDLPLLDYSCFDQHCCYSTLYC